MKMSLGKWGNAHGAAAALGGYVFSMLIVFRAWIASGFDLGFGDRADGLIEISLLEHWRNVILHGNVWNQPLYFYPHPDVMGYNDGYFLFGVNYTILRFVFDPFTSDVLNVAAFKTLGFFGTYFLCKRSLQLERPIALVIAIIFTIANGLMAQAVHAQLQSVGLLPFVAMLAMHTIKLVRNGRPNDACWAGAGLAAWLAAWFLTSFYMAWFTVFFGALFIACWIAYSPHQEARLLQVIRLLKVCTAPLAVFVVFFLLLSAPFFYAYLPKLNETGGHGFSNVAYYLVWPFDPTNVGRDNYVWGWIYRALHAIALHFAPPGADWPDSKFGNEHVSGFPLLLFAMVVASASRAMSRQNNDKIDPALRALALAIVIGWACTIQLEQIPFSMHRSRRRRSSWRTLLA